jgi:hypothetical protein
MSNKLSNKNIIMACQITGVYDVNRNEIIPDDDYTSIEAWCKSIIRLDLSGIIFHNNYSQSFCEKYSNKHIKFVQINYDASFNPNVYRYILYQKYLETDNSISNIFLTDISDVTVLQNPFETDLFKNNPTKIFCGDEPKKLNDEWMQAHNAHLRNNIKDFAPYEKEFEDANLLNCGIIGGNIKIMKSFINKLCHIHITYNQQNTTPYTGDMGAFNYLVRTQYNESIIHGYPVNTVFKGHEESRNDCWFKHK